MENINSKKLIDMHIHTINGSPGDASSNFEQILVNAKANNCEYIGITDHNSFAGLKEIMKKYNLPPTKTFWEIDGVKVVPGVEVTCKIKDGNSKHAVHMLVYGAEFEKSNFKRLIELKEQHDLEKKNLFLKYLGSKMGVKIDEKMVNDYMIQNHKHTFEWSCAQKFLLSNGIRLNQYNELKLKRLFNIQNLTLQAKDVVKLAHSAGGICVVAHPTAKLVNPNNKQEHLDLAKSLAKINIDGVEKEYNFGLKYPANDFIKELQNQRALRGITKKLIFSAGSDNHHALLSPLGTLQSKNTFRSSRPLYSDQFSIVNELNNRHFETQQKRAFYSGTTGFLKQARARLDLSKNPKLLNQFTQLFPTPIASENAISERKMLMDYQNLSTLLLNQGSTQKQTMN